ncbi:hypothetical protein BDF19DRAFT_421283 [Syncephalis fuscata]|nr:hypothetical protein BDF19DRAFT_421283 [Syncephalis fuscata]
MSRESSGARSRAPQLMERIRSTRPISPTLSSSSGQSPPLRARPGGVHRRLSSQSTQPLSVVPPTTKSPALWSRSGEPGSPTSIATAPWADNIDEVTAAGLTAHAATRQAIFEGLVKVMQTLEDRAAAVRETQDELQQEVVRIQAELRRFSESAKAPNLTDAAQRLVHARNKLENVNNLLLRVQERLDRLCAQVTQHIEATPSSS